MPHGRTVRAYEVRPPDVPLVVGIHGTPSTGLRDIVNYVATGAVFCRLVTFDRQGYGGSTPQPGRKVSDIATIVDAVLDHLSVDAASVYGNSGGGPHALATAALLPERISRVACLAGIGPSFGPRFDYAEGQTPLMLEEILTARSGRDVSHAFFKRTVDLRLNDPQCDAAYFYRDPRSSQMSRSIGDCTPAESWPFCRSSRPRWPHSGIAPLSGLTGGRRRGRGQARHP
ncbi:alpha/beta hydrolase [Mesorhizobium sp. M0189]|uniref:alpha/beta fold hydrolase n=1 Tax=Mesorhizobium sp. M0189 TaxID=2956909 RepID=UPI003334A8DE